MDCFIVDCFAVFWHNCRNLAFGWPDGDLLSISSFSGVFLKFSSFLKLKAKVESLKDTHREKAPSNKPLVLRKSTDMGVSTVGRLNQLFKGGS